MDLFVFSNSLPRDETKRQNAGRDCNFSTKRDDDGIGWGIGMRDNSGKRTFTAVIFACALWSFPRLFILAPDQAHLFLSCGLIFATYRSWPSWQPAAVHVTLRFQLMERKQPIAKGRGENRRPEDTTMDLKNRNYNLLYFFDLNIHCGQWLRGARMMSDNVHS